MSYLVDQYPTTSIVEDYKLFADYEPKTKVEKPKIEIPSFSPITNNHLQKVIFDDSMKRTTKMLGEFSNKFQLIYLDPPYNTKRARGSRKSYTDKVHSDDWAISMSTIIENSHKLLTTAGFLAISINQMELFNLKSICDKVFSEDCFIGLFPVKIRHSERQLMINATYHDVYEYLLFYRKTKQTRFFTDFKDAKVEKFAYQVKPLNDNPKCVEIVGKTIEIYEPDEYKIIKTTPNLDNLRRYIIAGKLATANWSGEFFESHLRSMGSDKLIKVHGLEKEGLGYRWFETQNDKRNSGVYYQSSITAGRPILPTNDLDYTEIVPNIYKEGGADCDFKDSKKPEQLLDYIISICSQENDLIGDFFGGSGTTIAKAIKMNRACVTIENNQNSLDIILNRLTNLKSGLDYSGQIYNFEYIVE